MKTLNIDNQDRLSVIRLDHGATNAISTEMVVELGEVLQDIRAQPDISSVVLTSSNDKFFSIGFDIPNVYELPREEFIPIYRSFNQLCLDLFTFPKPTIAAINGHAIAGGTILALCCDYRYISEGHKLMGLNEIKLGVPVPYLADIILNQVVGSSSARKMVESGELYPPGKLADFGLVDGILPPDDLLSRAIETAITLGAHPQGAFEVIKNNRVDPILQQYQQKRSEKEKQFIDCWYSPVARKLLQAAMEKF